jgi:pimeloyl-ACP methyl ester carboxylesterase
MKKTYLNYNYDINNIRYSLVKSIGKGLDWIFIPGGPGADSSYLLDIINNIEAQGNFYLIDLPGGGNHIAPEDYDFNNWFKILPEFIAKFTKPIIVGHSFGGMLPLLHPELETMLSGLIIINSAPSLWLAESQKLFAKNNIPLLPEKEIFIKEPNQDNFIKALKAYIPYYFNLEYLEIGQKFINNLIYPYHTSNTIMKILIAINYNATWIPQKVKCMLIGGEFDIINPFSIFQKDSRFKRENIKQILLKEAGHWCWTQKPNELKQLIENFSKAI